MVVRITDENKIPKKTKKQFTDALNEIKSLEYCPVWYQGRKVFYLFIVCKNGDFDIQNKKYTVFKFSVNSMGSASIAMTELFMNHFIDMAETIENIKDIKTINNNDMTYV